MWRTAAVLVLLAVSGAAVKTIEHEYCIIGSGPGGLQLGHLLLSSNRDYRIFEKVIELNVLGLAFPFVGVFGQPRLCVHVLGTPHR